MNDNVPQTYGTDFTPAQIMHMARERKDGVFTHTDEQVTQLISLYAKAAFKTGKIEALDGLREIPASPDAGPIRQ